MRKVAILTDGGSDLPSKLIDEYEISIIPYRIIFDEDVFYHYNNDKTTISREDFYARLACCGKENLPHTSVPAPGHFMKGFQEALDVADSVIAIFLSSKQSGTVQSAQRLVEARFPEKDITIFDSNQIMSGIGVQALHAARLAAEGKNKQQIISELEKVRNKVRTIFVFQNLEYLFLQGRIGRAKKLMATAFGMNPALYVNDGVIEPLGVLNKGKISQHLCRYLEQALKNSETKDLFFWHTRNLELAEEIYDSIKDSSIQDKDLHFQEASPLPGLYCGPNALSISYVGDWNKDWLMQKV